MRPFLNHHILHRQVEACRVDYFLSGGFYDFLCLTDPVFFSFGLSGLDIDCLMGLDRLIDGHRNDLATEALFDLLSGAGGSRSERPIDNDDACFPQMRRHPHQSDNPVDLAPVAGRQ